ncbi:hypothetical protein CDAR_75861 [Caerostris darwini]|uniref:Uncharacterized protein n=1 Tax=Caerostris darwini TaxID=1538125 RepID=A0AAV4W2H9_9ARAC|nr:hypothetical protein CDAR_75861 [Caerostris darwini]
MLVPVKLNKQAISSSHVPNILPTSEDKTVFVTYKRELTAGNNNKKKSSLRPSALEADQSPLRRRGLDTYLRAIPVLQRNTNSRHCSPFSERNELLGLSADAVTLR